MLNPTFVTGLSVALAIGCSLVSAYVATAKKNRSALVWGVLGFLYPLISVAVIWGLPVAVDEPAREKEPMPPSVLGETSSVMAQVRTQFGRTF